MDKVYKSMYSLQRLGIQTTSIHRKNNVSSEIPRKSHGVIYIERASRGPHSGLTRDSLCQVFQGHVHLNSEHLWGQRVHSLLKQPIPVADEIPSEFFFGGISLILPCACCLLSYHYAVLRRSWLCLLYTLPLGSCRQQ